METTTDQKILDWAEERDLFTKSNPLKQLEKTLEEVIELRDEVVRYDQVASMASMIPSFRYLEMLEEIHDKAKKELGDIHVTLTILAKMLDMVTEECKWLAYNKIANRTGTTVGGKFVKDAE